MWSFIIRCYKQAGDIKGWQFNIIVYWLNSGVVALSLSIIYHRFTKKRITEEHMSLDWTSVWQFLFHLWLYTISQKYSYYFMVLISSDITQPDLTEKKENWWRQISQSQLELSMFGECAVRGRHS